MQGEQGESKERTGGSAGAVLALTMRDVLIYYGFLR
jgi:hypothetical protein